MRRETLENFALGDGMRDGLRSAAEEKIKDMAGDEKGLEKYRRRAELAEAADIISAAFGPAPPAKDASENEVIAELQLLNGQTPQPGASLIWDQQFVTRCLINHSPLVSVAETFGRLLQEVYEDAIEEGIVWVELMWETLVKKGNDVIAETTAARWLALVESWGRLEAEYSGRVGVQFVLGCPQDASGARVLCQFLNDTQTSHCVCGVGQWGLEVSAEERAEAYAVCLEAGFPAVCVHAGEHALQAGHDEGGAPAYNGPAMVRAAVEAAKARRVGHGIEAAKSTAAMAELAARSSQVCLEVCPVSNLRLGYLPLGGLAAHPLPVLMEAGVACCLASDDPAYFGSRTAHGLVREYVAARHFMGLNDDQLAELARASIIHSRAPDGVKSTALDSIDAWLLS